MGVLLVTCAVLFSGQKVLCAQRSSTMPLPGLWEFPGGKIEEGESPEECLNREVREELGISIDIVRPMDPSEYSYTPGTLIHLLPFICCWAGGELTLTEHQAVKWSGKEELMTLEWAPADMPIVEELLGKWNNIQKQLVDYTKET
ncbi:(deoxy)nucleoside triphosphate pyrophosphohydrolase [Algoriphagus sp. AGSA1]|uniref:(deoxy)nucleoside triphosphate pyrophosphohydrolase n=1 Tax=Algoriphagus sp. AGSA1 TaxID=2907213 RepID=UPI001F38629D|nr:(deoxy)nucleoside triphosphate pyrophosphohydrolase [Algoriphagus sp. AGSA1]MCE7054743.1 (deoxy)nucleoside triphosphate pyrophosphohydrolase [Algoriphagus sp. AGSA1]